jgi:predicted ester cyclase
MHPPSNFDLATNYRNYINCLNAQDWGNLGSFVADDVSHNERPFGLSGYRAMLEQDFCNIPDLRFTIALLVADKTHVASRLAFDCSPQGTFLGLPVNGKRVTFTENVFYEFREHKIVQVWSVIDKAAIEAQLIPRQIPDSVP